MRHELDTGPLGLSAFVILVVGLAGILGAWGFQIFADLPPCPLCLKQRWPYYSALPLAALALGLLFYGRTPKTAAMLLGLVGLIFLAGSALALYHTGVEWKWWPGPTTCAGGAAPVAGTAAELLKQLQTSRVVACDEAPWRLFGVSLAGYNFLISLGLALIALWGLIRATRAYGSSSLSQ